MNADGKIPQRRSIMSIVVLTFLVGSIVHDDVNRNEVHGV